MHATGCAGRVELEEFAVGSLPEREFGRIADHVECCRDCEVTLQTLDHHTDPLLSQLRRLDGTEESRVESLSQGLIEAVRSARMQRGVGAWSSAEEGGRRLGKFEILERL